MASATRRSDMRARGDTGDCDLRDDRRMMSSGTGDPMAIYPEKCLMGYLEFLPSLDGIVSQSSSLTLVDRFEPYGI